MNILVFISDQKAKRKKEEEEHREREKNALSLCKIMLLEYFQNSHLYEATNSYDANYS